MDSLKSPYPWLYEAVSKTLDNPSIEEDVYHEMVVLGNFPKLPPNCVARDDMVSFLIYRSFVTGIHRIH